MLQLQDGLVVLLVNVADFKVLRGVAFEGGQLGAINLPILVDTEHCNFGSPVNCS